MAQEKLIIGEPGGIAGPWHPVVSSTGRVVGQFAEREDAEKVVVALQLFQACATAFMYLTNQRDVSLQDAHDALQNAMEKAISAKLDFILDN